MAKLQDEVNTANQVSTNRNDQDLGERFFFRLIPKFRAVANVIFFSFCYFFLDSRDGLRLKGGGGGGAARSLARKGRGVWERMKIILRGCDRERVKSKGRRKNKKSAKVTTNLKKNNRKIETEREELQESAKCNY